MQNRIFKPLNKTNGGPMNTIGKLILIGVLVVFIIVGAIVTIRFGTIETGNVGIYTRFGTVDKNEIQPGIYFNLFGSVKEFSGKEIAI